MMGYGAGLGFGLGWLWMLGLALLVVGVVLLVAWLVRRGDRLGQAGAVRPSGTEALDALRLRLARGEISRDEYLALKQTLEAGR